jgi:hypothetical protein
MNVLVKDALVAAAFAIPVALPLFFLWRRMRKTTEADMATKKKATTAKQHNREQGVATDDFSPIAPSLRADAHANDIDLVRVSQGSQDELEALREYYDATQGSDSHRVAAAREAVLKTRR